MTPPHFWSVAVSTSSARVVTLIVPGLMYSVRHVQLRRPFSREQLDLFVVMETELFSEVDAARAFYLSP